MPPLDQSFAGDAAAGGRVALSGKVYDLDVRQSFWNTHDVRWVYEAANAEEYLLGVYVDGTLISRVGSAAGQTSLAGMAEGGHSISIARNLAQCAWPDRHGESQGQRGYLEWTPPLDTTLAGYNVYWDEGGSLPDPTTLVARLTRVTVAQEFNQVDQVNGNHGRVNTWGNYDGGKKPINDPIVVHATSAGTWNYTTFAGLTGSGTFSQGQSVPLPHGAWIKFLDDPEDYGDDSFFGVWLGPAHELLTPVLDPGTHTFKVTSFDAAGNEDLEPLVTRRIYIEAVPPAADVSLLYDFDTQILTVKWAVPDSGEFDLVRLYTNWNPVTTRFEDHVIEDFRQVESAAAAGATGVEFPQYSDGHVGRLKFYVRTVKDGIERRDCTLRIFDFPPTAAQTGFVLGTPTNLKLTPIAAGRMRFEWDYRAREDQDSIDHFNVYFGTDHAWDWDAPGLVVSNDEGVDFPVEHFTVELETGGLADDTAVFAGVRSAVADDLVTSRNTNYATARTDKTPPAAVAVLWGVPQ